MPKILLGNRGEEEKNMRGRERKGEDVTLASDIIKELPVSPMCVWYVCVSVMSVICVSSRSTISNATSGYTVAKSLTSVNDVIR